MSLSHELAQMWILTLFALLRGNKSLSTKIQCSAIKKLQSKLKTCEHNRD